MKKFLNKKLHIFVLAVLAGVLIAAVFFAGLNYINAYKEKRAENIRLQKEKEELQDSEIANLKQEILALKNKTPEIQTINNTVTVKEKDSVSSVVKEWTPRVAHVECSWYNSRGALYGKTSGSATIVNFSNAGIRAVTSRHILIDSNRYIPRECKIELTSGAAYNVVLDNTNVNIGENEDWAYITLPKDSTLSNITKQNVKLCKNIEVGDKLLILGYPKIGSKTGPTVTEGILSGEDGNYYITSAKIDKGNSGGAALLVEDDCYLGIPSASVIGAIESLGRILKASFVISS